MQVVALDRLTLSGRPRRRGAALLVSLALAAGLWPAGAGADQAGAERDTLAYRGTLEDPSDAGGRVELTVEIDPVLFLATSLGGKYRPLRVRVRHLGTSDVALADGDSFRAFLPDGSEVAGVLDLQAADPALWDSLQPNERKELAYPLLLKAPTGSHGTPELSHFFAFLPVSVNERPVAFEYGLSHSHQTVRIQRPPETAARN